MSSILKIAAVPESPLLHKDTVTWMLLITFSFLHPPFLFSFWSPVSCVSCWSQLQSLLVFWVQNRRLQLDLPKNFVNTFPKVDKNENGITQVRESKTGRQNSGSESERICGLWSSTLLGTLPFVGRGTSMSVAILKMFPFSLSWQWRVARMVLWK